MSTTNVYIVTVGEYSDYHICGVFSTEEAANAYARLHSTSRYSDQYEVEEWELDASDDVNLIAHGRRPWQVAFFKPDRPWVTTKDTVTEPYEEQAASGAPYWVIGVEAEDEASAIKIAAEKRAHLMAENVGIT